MRLGRPLVPLEVTTEEQTLLESWARRRTTAQALALRARIVRRAAAGDSNTAIARRERVTKATVGKWRARFVRERLDGLVDEPRPGAPRQISDAHVERVITMTLESTPRDIHLTPTSASWLNLVERWFSLLTQKQIKRGAHRSTRELERAIRE